MQVIAPLFKTYYSNGKKIRLLYSLNNYLIPTDSKVTLNTYYPTRAKRELFQDITRQAKLLPKIPEELYPVEVLVTIYRQSNHGTDIGNYSVIEKFTTDALVQSGIFLDDNWKYISQVTFKDGGKDSENPRAVYSITKDGMGINLDSLSTSQTHEEPETTELLSNHEDPETP